MPANADDIAPAAPSGEPVEDRRAPTEAHHGRVVVFVVGMHRSGTSLTAGLLGANWGGLPTDLLPSSEGNAYGHFESKRLTLFNESLLRACGSAWDDAAPLDIACALPPDAHHRWFRRAGALLEEEFGDRDRLVFKDPRLCRLMPFWCAVARDRGLAAKAVLPLRHPDEVAASLQARDGLTPAYTLRLWLRNVLDADAGTEGMPRAYVSYDAILDDWKGRHAILAEQLGLGLGPTATGHHLVQSGLRHHRAGDVGDRTLPPQIARTFAALTAAASDKASPDATILDEARAWLDGEALSWSVLREEVTARRALLEASTESLDALVQRMADERDALLGRAETPRGRPSRPDDAGLRTRGAFPVPADRYGDADADASAEADGSVATVAHLRLHEAALSQTRALRTIADMRSSSSWQFTKPIRYAGYAVRHYLLRPLRALHNRILLHTHRAVARARPGNEDVARYFDAGWYRHSGARLPVTVHPLDHYIAGGHAEGREPAAWFDSARYRALAGLGPDEPPFVHFVRSGVPSGLFDPTDEHLAVAADILLRPVLPAGWRVAGLSDLSIRDGAFYSTGADPQIVMEPDRPLSAGVYIVTWAYSGARGLAPTLYFDIGDGFTPEWSAVMVPSGKGRGRCIVDLPRRATRLRFDPFEAAGRRVRLEGLSLTPVSLAALVGDRVRRRLGTGEIEGTPLPVSVRGRFLGGPRPFSPSQTDTGADAAYHGWIDAFDDDEADFEALRATVAELPERPLISVLMPVYNPPADLLDAAIQSVIEQVYPDWELCIANDASTAGHVVPLLDAWAAKDARIKVVHRPTNGHISHASNSALELVTGDWFALLDNDDVLRPNALAEMALAIAANPGAGLLYSDEDKIDEDERRFSPFFKPDFSPDLFASQNYLNHLTVHRTELVRKAGGWRPGYEGSQDYDLNLRVIAGLTRDQVVHVPKILYHWRAVEGSTAAENDAKGYAYEAGLKALRDATTEIGARVEPMSDVPFYRTIHPVPEPAPHVTLVIPTKDRRDLLERCVSSILAITDYPAFDIIVVDNDSEEDETRAYFESLADEPRIRVLPHPHAFNYSAINNAAVEVARGTILGLVNNDIEAIGAEWMHEMVSHAVREGVGCVGAKLYYPDDRVQHGGVVLGVGGVAGHASLNLPRSSPGYFGRLMVAHDVSAVTAACLFVRRAIWDEVGGLDAERLKVAFNDVDFCLKVREAGYRNVWTPFAELYHHESASRGSDISEEKRARFVGEVETMMERWGEALENDPYYNPNLNREAADFTPRRT